MRSRTSSVRRYAPILLLAASAPLFAQSKPSADQNTASVEGVAVNAVTGEPVARAHVALRGFADGKQRSYGAITVEEGKFSVTGLPAGRYSVSADRPGFSFSFDPRGSNTLSLKAGDHKDDVAVKLMPTGAISGTVVDADGEPVENCDVSAESSHGGRSSPSDAQGRFRLGGLVPGKYRLKAAPEDPRTPPEIRTDGTVESHFSATYYPNSLDEAGGAAVAIQPGNEIGGIEIRLMRTPIVRVGGKVTGIPPGAENVGLMIQQERDDNRGFGIRMNGGWSGERVKKDGTFAVWRLAPGAYRIGAQWNNINGQASASAPVEIVVGDSNIDGLELRVMPAADLAGQVEYESDEARPAAPPEEAQPGRRRPGPQLHLQGIEGTNWAANGPVDATGAFTVEKVLPGRYRVMCSGGQGYVRSMRLGTTEIAGDTLDLSGGVAGGALAIVISAQFGSVSGTVQGDTAATAGLRVGLFPDGKQYGGGVGFQFANIGAGGSYSFGSVIPGSYKLVAVAEDDVNAILQGGDEWDAYAPVTETVTIRAGESATQDLKILQKQ